MREREEVRENGSKPEYDSPGMSTGYRVLINCLTLKGLMNQLNLNTFTYWKNTDEGVFLPRFWRILEEDNYFSHFQDNL